MVLPVQEKEIVVYVDRDGKAPFSEWLDGLSDLKGRARIRIRINRVRLGNMGDCESVGGGVSELRVHQGPGYRVYFGNDGKRIVVLLCGGDKSSQKSDIKQAKRLFKDYKERKDEK